MLRPCAPRKPLPLRRCVSRAALGVVLAGLLATAPTSSAPASSGLPATVEAVDVRVPEGDDPLEAYMRIHRDVGLPLDEQLVNRHVERLGELGWVESVDVRIDPVDRDRYRLLYTLHPRPLIRNIRFEGNLRLDESRLRGEIDSREGRRFDLRQALDDAQQITLAYEERGLLFSGVLSQEDVRFQDGVLTFRIVEARLDEEERERLRARGVPVPEGPLTGDGLRRLLAEGELREALDLDDLRLRVDHRRGLFRLRTRDDRSL